MDCAAMVSPEPLVYPGHCGAGITVAAQPIAASFLRVAGLDAVGAASIPRDQMLAAFHHILIAQRSLENLQLRAAETLAFAGGHADRAVVFHQ